MPKTVGCSTQNSSDPIPFPAAENLTNTPEMRSVQRREELTRSHEATKEWWGVFWKRPG